MKVTDFLIKIITTILMIIVFLPIIMIGAAIASAVGAMWIFGYSFLRLTYEYWNE